MTLTAEQKQIRASGIGGSEIAAVAGLSPFGGPLDIWLRKTGAVNDDDISGPHIERGRHLGPGLASWFRAKTGLRVANVGDEEQTFVHPAHPLVIATPDGLVEDHQVLECKFPSFRVAHHWGQPGTDEVPDYYERLAAMEAEARAERGP